MDYKVYKFIQVSLLNEFEDELSYKELKNIILIEPDIYLNLVLQFIKVNQNTGFITPKIRENIYNLLTYTKENLKYENDEDKKNKYNIINQIIRTVNTFDFYLNELYYELGEVQKRYFDSYKTTVSKKEICNDLIYLNILLKENNVDDLHMLLLNDEFIGSVNAMIDENPDLVNNEQFINNLNIVLEMNLNTSNLLNACNLDKKMNKYIIQRTLNLKELIHKLSKEINEMKTRFLE